MRHLALSTEELSSGKLSAETLERACNQVALNGFVVLANAVAPEFIEKVHENWTDLVNDLLVNLTKSH